MVKISFLGDISLNNKYNDLYRSKINPFKNVQSILEDSDFVIGNLECLAEGDEGENLLKKPRLKTSLETLNYLKFLNIKVVSLANNHVSDNLFDGFRKTTNFLDKNNIRYIGAGISPEEARKPCIIEQDAIKISVLSYVHHDTNPSIPGDSRIFVNWFDKNLIIDDIEANKENHFVILLLHWGGKMEGANFPDYKLFKLGQELIKAGADLIIGHHSHTFQPYQMIYSKYIFYSLGNFCFSDIISDGKIKRIDKKSHKESIILSTCFTRKKYKIKIVPIKSKNMIIHPNKLFFIKILFRQLIFKVLKIEMFWQIYYYYHKYIGFLIYQLFRKDENRSFLSRIRTLNWDKIESFLWR